jgi:hypothetical protein
MAMPLPPPPLLLLLLLPPLLLCVLDESVQLLQLLQFPLNVLCVSNQLLLVAAAVAVYSATCTKHTTQLVNSRTATEARTLPKWPQCKHILIKVRTHQTLHVP